MNARRVESFLLRLVIQDNESIHPEHWRGRIQHIPTGNDQKIDQIQDVVAFIAAHLSASETNDSGDKVKSEN